jgi:hypothetical protein
MRDHLMPAPKKTPGNRRRTAGGDGRAVVTLPPAVAGAVRRMADTMDGDLGPAEVVRRGLILLDFYLSLTPEEDLVVRNKKSNELERIRIAWDSF